jgi:nucleoside phosphorylase
LSVGPPPIYLHFLDRELGDAFEFKLDLPGAQRALAILALGTESPLFCSLSALLENGALTADVGMIEDLVREDVLLPRSTHATMPEFLESRRTMYEHDRDRYPLYFGEPLGELEHLQPRFNPGSTTETLHGKLIGWTAGQATLQFSTKPLPVKPRTRMLGIVESELGHRDERAVTYAMFNKVLVGDPSGKTVEWEVRRRISLEYADIQRGEQSQLATGLHPQLALVEEALWPEAPFERDLQVLQVLLQAAGLGALLNGWSRTLWRRMLPLRGTQEHRRMVSLIQWIAAAIDSCVSAALPRDLRRRQAIALLKPHVGSVQAPPPSSDAREMLIAAQLNLAGLAKRLAGSQPIKVQLDASRDLLEPLQADVLLIVATDVELTQTLEEFGFPPKKPRRHPKGMEIYYELDTLAGRSVFLVRSNMGATGAGGSLFTASDAIKDLKPDWVVMVGIAWGADAATQQIGDVLVPTEVIPVDHQRAGTEGGALKIEFRDSPQPADPILLKRMRDGLTGFIGSAVTFGRVLSGSVLIDNEAYRDALNQQAARGAAIGGEMELHGLAAAAARENARWGAAKAICDFADGNKGKDKDAKQQLAARNAARFVRLLIEAGLLTAPEE